MEKISCSVEILTRNSALTLERCLESVKDFSEIILLDGNSTDLTLDIAARYGALIYKQYEGDEPLMTITDFSEVRNKGLRLAANDWFMFIDSDEYLSSEATDEIKKIIENPSMLAHAFWQPRKYVLGGKVVECASTYPNQQIRLFHRARVNGFIKPIHERIDLKPGSTVGWLNSFEYVPVGTIGELDKRWRRYIEKEEAMYNRASRKKILKVAFRQIALFCLYAARYFRNLIFCRGIRMPFIYEWTRHKYLLIFAARLLKHL